MDDNLTSEYTYKIESGTTNVQLDYTYAASNTDYLVGSSSFDSMMIQDISNHTLELKGDGNIKVGDTVMPIREFEACLKVIHDIAKNKYPEDFL